MTRFLIAMNDRMTGTNSYVVVHDPLRGWQVVDTENDTHTCHSDQESAMREARRREMNK